MLCGSDGGGRSNRGEQRGATREREKLMARLSGCLVLLLGPTELRLLHPPPPRPLSSLQSQRNGPLLLAFAGRRGRLPVHRKVDAVNAALQGSEVMWSGNALAVVVAVPGAGQALPMDRARDAVGEAGEQC